jgi:hypothetical protein
MVTVLDKGLSGLAIGVGARSMRKRSGSRAFNRPLRRSRNAALAASVRVDVQLTATDAADASVAAKRKL